MPYATPCDMIKWVTLVENELRPRARHMMANPAVENQRRARGNANMMAMTMGVGR